MSESLNFQATTNTPVSDGATALKLQDEVHVNNEVGLNESQISENINETTHNLTSEIQQETLANDPQDHNIQTHDSSEAEPSNGLENFGLQEEGSFELFDNNETQTTLTEEEKETEEDELEIPAFLRRQKN